jgi:crotonobetaine/carnitine-CoA ligase
MRRDADGYFSFVDRMRDVIRRRAVNISSFDVETVIGGHPAVAECAAVAVPSEFAGGEDEIKICLVQREGASVGPEDFLGWCEDRLRETGVAGVTWDRVQAGYRMREEIKREEARRARATKTVEGA